MLLLIMILIDILLIDVVTIFPQYAFVTAIGSLMFWLVAIVIHDEDYRRNHTK